MYEEEYAEGVQHIAEAVDFVLGRGHDPGSGLCYHNDVFEMHGFWNHWDEDCDGVDCGTWDSNRTGHYADCRLHESNDWYFHHKPSGFKYSWYKRIGRSPSVVTDVEPLSLEWYKIVVECLESVRDDPAPDWNCARR